MTQMLTRKVSLTWKISLDPRIVSQHLYVLDDYSELVNVVLPPSCFSYSFDAPHGPLYVSLANVDKHGRASEPSLIEFMVDSRLGTPKSLNYSLV